MLAIFCARAGVAAGLPIPPFPPILLTYLLPLRVSYHRKYPLDEK